MFVTIKQLILLYNIFKYYLKFSIVCSNTLLLIELYFYEIVIQLCELKDSKFCFCNFSFLFRFLLFDLVEFFNLTILFLLWQSCEKLILPESCAKPQTRYMDRHCTLRTFVARDLKYRHIKKSVVF